MGLQEAPPSVCLPRIMSFISTNTPLSLSPKAELYFQRGSNPPLTLWLCYKHSGQTAVYPVFKVSGDGATLRQRLAKAAGAVNLFSQGPADKSLLCSPVLCYLHPARVPFIGQGQDTWHPGVTSFLVCPTRSPFRRRFQKMSFGGVPHPKLGPQGS